MLHQAAADPRQSRRARGVQGVIVDEHAVVVEVGDRPTHVGMQTLRHDPDVHRLEMHHEMAADERVLDPRQQKQTRRLDGSAGDDDIAGTEAALDTVGADDIHAGGLAPVGANPRDEGLRQKFGPTRAQGVLQHGHRIALGMDRAAEIGAVPAVVARRTAVVGDRVWPPSAPDTDATPHVRPPRRQHAPYMGAPDGIG